MASFHRLTLPLFVCLLLLTFSAAAQTFVYNPTTTLTAETANNTSAADTFPGQSNGNPPPRNTSKLPIRSLLYNGSTTRIYAHFMPWFGQGNHLNIGYNSADVAQVKRQVDDMLSRGIEGVVIDWYGPNFAVENNTTLAIKADAEARGGQFIFAVMEDAGALGKCAQTAGCDITQRLIDDLTYAYYTYMTSPAYMLLGGRPAVFFFGVDKYVIDWDRVRQNVLGNPVFIFQGTSGFSHAHSDGAFSWIAPNASNPDDEGLSYLDNFYTTAKSKSGQYTFGSAYPGFDNSLAPWVAPGTGKVMKQKCGQTWMDTLARTGNHYSSTNQLFAIQLVTWNDYEEGTEIETGVDNCISVSGTMSGSTLTWTLGGQGKENTLDRYTVFISEDGEQLMQLANVAIGTQSLNLASFGLDPAKTYTLYIQAHAKASMQNHISGPVSYKPANQPPNAVLSVSPTSGTAPLAVTASTSNSTDADGTIASSRIDFGDGTVVTATNASHTYSTAGTYTVRATITDNVGASSNASATVTASAASVSCTISTINRTITICAPKSGQTVARPVRVLAFARDSSSVQYMQVFVDGVKVYTQYNTKSIDTYINMTARTHNLKVSAKDNTGIFSKTVTFTAQ
jgi:PKD repeat protein